MLEDRTEIDSRLSQNAWQSRFPREMRRGHSSRPFRQAQDRERGG